MFVKYIGVLVISFLLPLQVNSKELHVGFASYKAPFVFIENNVHKGIEIDIVREAFNYKGHSIKSILLMPYSRLKVGIKSNYADVIAGVQLPKEDDGTFYSESYIAFDNYAISLKGSNVTITDIEDLKNYSIATWKNAYLHLGPVFKKIYNPQSTVEHEKYLEFSNQVLQVEYFLLNRAEVIVIDKGIFYWLRSSILKNIKTREIFKDLVKDQEYIFHKISANTTTFNANFADEQIRNDFNEGLKYLKESGKYQEIIDRYVVAE